MKKNIVLILACACFIFGFSGCGKTEKTDDGKLKVVATIFPAYDFARSVCGDTANVTLLLPPGAESHSFEPTPQDIINIQNADLFIYVGGESDSWVDDILKSMSEPVKTLKMMDCVTTVEEEIVEGMEEEQAEESGSDENQGDEIEYDEHVWTSPKNAIKIVKSISTALCGISKENEKTFTDNTDKCVSELEQLDKDFSDFFSTVTNKTLVFGDRFPFRYFADEYGLTYYAAFPGCSTETEPSAATIAFLIDKVKSEGITTVFYIEFSTHVIADTIAESTGAAVTMLHSCHNVSEDDIAAGTTYISLMKQNLETLKTALK